MQELEAAFGRRPLGRTTRGLSPTEAGRRLHARPAPLPSNLDAALREAADLHDQPRGLLHVVPAVAGFRADYPEVELDLGPTEEAELRPSNGTDLVTRLACQRRSRRSASR